MRSSWPKACDGTIKRLDLASESTQSSSQRGSTETLYTTPPEGPSYLDEMGPESAKSFRDEQLVPPRSKQTPEWDKPTHPRERATQEIDYCQRGEGYVFGAFRPASGEALPRHYPRWSTIHWVDLLEKVEGRIPADVGHVYAIVANLQSHRARQVLLFVVGQPR